MYKYLQFFAVVALAQAAQETAVEKVMNKCIEKHNLPSDEMYQIWNKIEGPDDNADYTKFFVCIFTEFKVIKDNEVDFERLTAVLPSLIEFRYNLSLEKSKAVLSKLKVDDCYGLPRTADIGLYGIQVRNCLIKGIIQVVPNFI